LARGFFGGGKRGLQNEPEKCRKNAGKILGMVLISWWLFLLIGFGLGGNALMIYMTWQSGNLGGMLLFTTFFIGACVYLYRTYDAREEIRGNLRD
jgi:hypothetical protein